MGGCCCCCASESTEQNSTPAYFHYPASEVHEPLSSHISTVAALSTGILVDTNLDTSVPDTYRSPPAPIPFGPPLTPPSNQENPGNKVEVALQTTNTNVVEDTNLETKLTSLNSDGKAEINIELAASKESENENENSEKLTKSVEPLVPSLQDEEDVCPTCFEEYDSENPKIITVCDHHFHLACILEWMERSYTCPICGQEMAFSPFTGE